MKSARVVRQWGQHPCVRECQKTISSLPLTSGSPLLVAVSGGADSLGLLYVLKEFFPDFSLHILHFNHQLRGEESERDEHFVCSVAEKLTIPYSVGRANVHELARESKKTLEVQARESRYQFFAEKAQELGANFLCMGHHAGDQAELFFLRLLRGASAVGLKGMEPLSPFPYPSGRPLQVVRPLLGCTHGEIEDFLRQQGLSWVEDSSNQCEDILRNKIRHQLLPLLESDYRPGIGRNLLRTMGILSGESDYLEKELLKTREAKIPFETWHVALQRRAVAAELIRLGVTPLFEQVDFLLRHPGKSHHCQGQLLYRKEGEATLFLEERTLSWDSQEVSITFPEGKGWTERVDLPGTSPAWMEWSLMAREEVESLTSKPAQVEFFDADAVGSTILLRHWHQGDRFRPIGMNASQKLQDIFVDHKIPQEVRHQLWLAQGQTGELFLAQSVRIADFAKVTSATKRVLKLTLPN